MNFDFRWKLLICLAVYGVVSIAFDVVLLVIWIIKHVSIAWN
jgi:hypothetical protein